ncbi:MAG: hypothetical protein A2Z99_14550 [Treponema sp. GWB1_62_6]|nr:MAG: hypothetical protein A2Z99_14550 [Treponema sp. GWB1_62_6]OHE68818.1 MAG: hypothetical protein A2001_20855 [Treponema sp. GWC1_61_84]
MIDFKHLALDGRKIQASANFRNNVDRARGKKQLELEPNDALAQERIDERIKRLERKEIRLAQTLAVLESYEDEKPSLNMVDPDAKIMKHKDRRILPSYNQQSVVDGTFGIISAVATTKSGDKPGDLFAMVDAAKENAGGSFDTCLPTRDSPTMKRFGRWKRIGRKIFMFRTSGKKLWTTRKQSAAKFDKSNFHAGDDGLSMHCPAGKGMHQGEGRETPGVP